MTVPQEDSVAKMRVLVVCLGNICRSPMAEGIFLDRVRKRGWDDVVEIDSAGTAAYHVGERPDPRTLDILNHHGIQLHSRARQVRDEDFLTFDWVLAMDDSNLADLTHRCPPTERHRLSKILTPIGGGNVADPYYGGADGFARNFEQLDRAVEAWLDQIPKNARL